MAKKVSYSNQQIAELLRSVAAAYILQNQNRFKIVAYEKAADSVEHLSRELYDIWQDEKMDEVPGLGPSIQSSLDELFQTGHSKHLEAVISSIPAPVFELMKVTSIGPKTAFKLVNELKLSSSKHIFQDVQKAAEKNVIASIPTFGEKSQQEILEAIKRYQSDTEKVYRMPLPYADKLATQIITYIKQIPSVLRADELGSLRRRASTIGDIDIAVALEDGNHKSVIEHFLKYPSKLAVENSGDKKASIIVPPNIRVDLAVQDLQNYGSMLQYFTGNKAHNIQLREQAIKQGYSLSEHGIKNIKTGEVKEFADEEGFYAFLGYQYVPPELRDGTNELEIAKKHELPHLVELKDMKGDLHIHSSYPMQISHDAGANSYLELARKAQELKYEYVGFSDHNPKSSGLTKEEIVQIMKKRKQDIDQMMKKSFMNYFISLETDITPSGELALPDEALQYVDYLVVAVHSSFSMNREDMTKRVLKALSKPKVKVLGHPTGRLLGKRNGFEMEWNKIFEAVKKHDVALEINSWPERLDLPDILVREAIREKVMCVINTDAHAVPDMDNMPYGISVARRGWATKSDIMNTLPYSQFRSWVMA